MPIDLGKLDRELDAIVYAAEKLGYKVAEVEIRMEKIHNLVATGANAHEIRQYVIAMRGWDQPPQFATSAFLDDQLDRLIGLLSTDEQRAEEAALAARLTQTDWFDEQCQAGRGVTW